MSYIQSKYRITFLNNKQRISLYSISFAVEEITREARIGHDYVEEEASSGHISIQSPQKQARIHFRKNTKLIDTNTVGYIESCKEIGNTNCDLDDNWIPITDVKLINIKNFLVDSVSPNNGEIVQPRLSIFVSGEYNTRGGQTEEVSLQTQVVQRVLDVNDTSIKVNPLFILIYIYSIKKQRTSFKYVYRIYSLFTLNR